VNFLDIPKVLDFKEQLANDFFRELSDSDDFELFQKKAIRKIIDFKYPIVIEYTMKFLFIPYFLFVLSFLFYQNYSYPKSFEEEEGKNTWATLNLITIIFIIVVSLFFFINEMVQFKKHGIYYLFSIWNYIDLGPPILAWATVGMDIVQQKQTEPGITETTIRITQGVASFFIWIKFLYFLRVFDTTGYLIRMIIDVIRDMRAFMIILLVTIIAFANSFFSISEANLEEDKFVSGFLDSIFFTYRLSLGDWDTESMGQKAQFFVWLLFVLCTVFNLIVMLNLLIAIISETFANVNSNAESAAYQEKARIIYENSYLIPYGRKLIHCQPNTYLLFVEKVIQDIEDEEEAKSEIDELKAKLNKIQKGMNNRFAEIKTLVASIKEKNDDY